ncbi:sex hormone-binding globulin isoform X2 [Erinaceus europaeus]|uniref:Sex hormone-binding globulin n=1 Tax=Erinaceus europaeus TaxID=9365 RepID=A0ABM3YGU8_ERIEU|nr:sex hormone-binding globulin isoform X2 [Erinaceus europaeus]
MESRGPLVTSHLLPLLLLLLLPHNHHRWALGQIPSTQSQPTPAIHLSNGPGPEPVTIITFEIARIRKTSSSFELRTWDPEGVILYGNRNSDNDWFMLGLRNGRAEIQMHNYRAQVTVSAGPQLNDGKWHQIVLKSHEDTLLLKVDGEEVLCLRQVFGPMTNKSETILNIALGGLLFPTSSLRLPLAPALDGCLRRGSWLDPQAQMSVSTHASLRSCAVESRPGIFFPPGTHAEFSLYDIPQPSTKPWSFSLDLELRLAAGTGNLLTLGTLSNSSWLSLYLQDQVVLSSGSEANLDLPLVLGLPLHLKLDESSVVLSQGQEKTLALPPSGPGSFLNLWVHPQGRLFLGALPGEVSSASFCLDSLWVQGQQLDMDQALGRSQDLWTHSCPVNSSNNTGTAH